MALIIKVLAALAALVATAMPVHHGGARHVVHAHVQHMTWQPLSEALRQALSLPHGCRIHYADTTIIRCPDGEVITS